MGSTKTMVLDHASILTKLERMACEICEKHTSSERLLICGLNQRGFFLATEISNYIVKILPLLKTELIQIDTHSGNEPVFSPNPAFEAQHVLLVDDVINTGFTLMQVLQKVFSQKPLSIGTAFLAKREHRNFPVKADYVGISLATTLQQHVNFDNSNSSNLQVYLS